MHKQTSTLNFTKLNFWQGIQIAAVIFTAVLLVFTPPTWVWQVTTLLFAVTTLMAFFSFNQQKMHLQYESKLLIQLLTEDMLNRIATEADDGVKKRLFGGVCEVMVHNPLMYSDFLTMLERKVQKDIILYGTSGRVKVWQEILSHEIAMGASYEKPTPEFKNASRSIGSLQLIDRACAPRP